MTTYQAEWFERAWALEPLVSELRDEGERDRELPKAVWQARRAAGPFSMWVPRALGGNEVELETMVRVARAYLYEVCRENWALLSAGRPVSQEVAANNRPAYANATGRSVEAVDMSTPWPVRRPSTRPTASSAASATCTWLPSMASWGRRATRWRRGAAWASPRTCVERAESGRSATPGT